MFIGRTDAEAKTPILWLPHVKSWLIWKDPDAGKDWGQQEKGTTEDEMAGWHHWLNGHEFWWTPGVGDGQGGLPCCGSWGRKESDMTERLNWTEYSLMIYWENFGLCFSLLPVHERTGWIFSLCSINCPLAFPNIQPGHMGQRLYFPAFSITSPTVWLCPSQ